jgi:1,4-alpha-glucan branching enzyme
MISNLSSTKNGTKKSAKNGAKKTVRFELAASPSSEVLVAGTFNDWQPCKMPLKSKKEGVFALDVPVPEGKHEYKFVVNGQWVPDPKNPEWSPNTFGSLNSVLQV